MEAVVDAPGGAASAGAHDHVVQFYRHGAELAHQAGDYLATAIRDGGIAIAIATPEHRLAFEERMAEAGIDVPGAGARGDYLALDAAETLRQIVTGDNPDPARFELVIGRLIRQAADTGRAVRAYGELVALMWDAGAVTGAVEIEELWTGLGRRYPFGLWCGYRADQMSGADLADAVSDVCRLHAVTVGDSPAGCTLPGSGAERTVRRRYPASLDEPGRARRFATAAMEAWGIGDLADDVALVAAELTANAVVHARSGFTITVTARADTVLVSVRDAVPLPAGGAGSALPAAPLHGLGAVAALAAAWGAEPVRDAADARNAGDTGDTGAGKVVWAELTR